MVRPLVALRKEGVDRNNRSIKNIISQSKSPSARRAWIEMHPTVDGGCGRGKSPSARRAWIEIAFDQNDGAQSKSPSARRAWIEMLPKSSASAVTESPSARRAWIEIGQKV